jgi:hypothetical protein
VPTWDDVRKFLLDVLKRLPAAGLPLGGVFLGLDLLQRLLREADDIRDAFRRNILIRDDAIIPAFETAAAQFPAFFPLVTPLLITQHSGGVLAALTAGRLEQFRNLSRLNFRPSLLAPDQAADLAVRGFLDTGLAYSHGRLGGYSDEVLNALFDAARKWQSEGTYTTALFRGALDLREWAERMDRLGVRREDHVPIIEAARPRPSAEVLTQALYRGELTLAQWRERMLRLGFKDDDLPVLAVAGRTLPSAADLTTALFRGELTLAQWRERMLRHGYRDEDLPVIAAAHRQLLPPTAYVTAAFRKHLDFARFIRKMHALGYADDDIETLVAAMRYYPTPAELVTWQAREVYEPESVRKYGLEEELDRLDREPFYRAGMDDEQIRNHWVAHWQHPPFEQVAVMLQRDILVDPEARTKLRPGSPEWREHRRKAEDEVYEWFRLVEIPPYWRRKLIQMVYAPLTRIDARRMWDLGVLDDDGLLRAYLDLGYDEQNARALLLWTKLFERVPDIIARYRNGWIGEQEVLTEIEELGADPRTARRIYETKIRKPVQQERVARERDLTKAEIIKGAKLGLISIEDAQALLEGLGYDPWEAQYVLAINLEAGSSPETLAEFERLVALHRKATGKEAQEPPPELLRAERRALEARRAVEEAQAKGAPQEELDRLRADMLRAQAVADEMRRRLGATRTR